MKAFITVVHAANIEAEIKTSPQSTRLKTWSTSCRPGAAS